MEDGPPIEGRIVDLEGRPVADARLGDIGIGFNREGGLSAWIDRVRDRDVEYPVHELESLPGPDEVRTGPDGRFRLAGIGRDRLVRLSVSGPRITTTRIHVATRDGAAVRITDSHRVDPEESQIVVYPRLFECAVAPSRPIEGVIRDKDTGRPLAGLKVWAKISVKGFVGVLLHTGIEATTDAQGRYRLTGLPIATSYHFQVTPGPGQPYTAATFHKTAGRASQEPLSLDVELKRGIVVRGRLTDKATGRSVLGGVSAYIFADNPHVREYPGYDDTYQSRASDAEDGRYEIVTPPGRGIIAGSADRASTAIAASEPEAIVGYDFKPDEETAGSFRTLPQTCSAANYHVLAEVNLDPKVESVTLDLQVDPGRSLTIHVVDPLDRPLDGTKASGVTDFFSDLFGKQELAEIVVHALDPSRPRRVIVRHDGRRLIGSIYLKGDEGGSRTMKLGPWGAIVGRIVDANGRPVAGVPLYNLGNIYREPPADRGILPGSVSGPTIHTGPDGRFRVEGLVPGLKYGASGEIRGPCRRRVLPRRDRRPRRGQGPGRPQGRAAQVAPQVDEGNRSAGRRQDRMRRRMDGSTQQSQRRS